MCNENSKCCNPPPLGLRPKSIWLEARVDEIYEAIERYREAGKDIPMGWIDELLAIHRAINNIMMAE